MKEIKNYFTKCKSVVEEATKKLKNLEENDLKHINEKLDRIIQKKGIKPESITKEGNI